jgi:uncharacterized protein
LELELTSLQRKVLFTVNAFVLTFLAVDVSLAWLFISALIHPPCHEKAPIRLVDVDRQEIPLTAPDGTKVRAWYYPSQNGAVILAMGGMGGSLGQNLPPVGFLIEQGYGVLQIDSRACAQTPQAVTLGADEILDAAAGLEYLRSLPEVDSGRIGAMGFSMGGVTAIRTAARHPEIAGLVAEGGYANLGEHFLNQGGDVILPVRFLLYSVAGVYWLRTGVNPWEVSPQDDITSISPRPIFLIYGEHEGASGHATRQYEAAGEPKILWIVPNGVHGGNHLVAAGEYERRVIEFFDHVLQRESGD